MGTDFCALQDRHKGNLFHRLNGQAHPTDNLASRHGNICYGKESSAKTG